MSRSRKHRLDVLIKRRDYLKGRIDEFASDERTSYMRAEVRALEWAMPILEAHIEANRILHEQLKESTP
jgi:hypothetical protein